MKVFRVSLAATLAISTLSNSYSQDNLQDHSEPPSSMVEVAIQNANREDKFVLLYFGAEGCVYCEQLNRVLRYHDIHSILDNHFIQVRIDVEEFDKNMDLLSLYMGKKVTGIPALVILRKNGTVKEAISGEEWGESDQEVYDSVMPFLLQMTGN